MDLKLLVKEKLYNYSFDRPISIYEVCCTILKNHLTDIVNPIVAAEVKSRIVPLSHFIIEADNIKLIFKNDLSINVYNQWMQNTGSYFVAWALTQQFPGATIVNINSNDKLFWIDIKYDDNFKNDILDTINLLVDKALLDKSLIINPIYIEQPLIKNKLKLINKYYYDNYVADDKRTLLQVNELFLWLGSYLQKTPDQLIIKALSLSGSSYTDKAGIKQTLQRICGSAFNNQQAWDDYSLKMRELPTMDHRYFAKQLELYLSNDLIGQGFFIWLPNGVMLRNLIKDYLRSCEKRYGYQEVQAPIVGSESLYQMSGHLNFYKENMFPPMTLDHQILMLKPMSCPHHALVFKMKPRSYKDLPLRLADHTWLYRYEFSGALSGLHRTRSMELTDAHLFVRPDQIMTEIVACYALIKEVLDHFGIHIKSVVLSTRNKNNHKYIDDDQMWLSAEAILQDFITSLAIPYEIKPGEAAFYGPKLDIQINTVYGQEMTLSTIQLDFQLAKNFDLFYYNEAQQTTSPIVIHRGLIGTYERFIAVLLEQYKGILPVRWAITQAMIITVANTPSQLKYAESVGQLLEKASIRFKLNVREERLAFKIREAQVQKIEYQLVIGNQETENKTISIRKYNEVNFVSDTVQNFIKIFQTNYD